MSEFQISELKFWRKRHGLSQGKVAKLFGLGLNTIMKIKAGVTKTQGRTQLKLTQAVHDYEASLKKATVVTAGGKDDQPVVTTPAASEIQKELASEIQIKTNSPKPRVLSNLDLELITRILMMTPIEKINLLKSLIE